MVNKTENTEQRIINAAREVFLKKGMDGARMQEIADEAGINKSLLHYYFRSKEKLFDQVFTDTFGGIINTINNAFGKSQSLDEFIEIFVSGYIKMLIERPFIPNFIFNELSQNPDRIVKQMTNADFDKVRFFEIMNEAGIAKDYQQNPVHVLVDILALCVFPFVARPLITGFIFEDNEEAFQEFIQTRSDHVIKFIKSALFSEKL